MSANAFAAQLALYAGELRALKQTARAHLRADVRLIARMEKSHLTGGKRVRAVVALLAARLCGLPKGKADKLAIAIEFIHTATLLHDDVVDAAPMRRRQPSAARAYGNAAAVLAGDFLYSRASQILADMGSAPLLQRVANATNKLSQGEILQLQNRGRPNMDEATYHAIIERKTANLFEVAACAPAIVAAAAPRAQKALAEYGRELGMAFQLTDDCLDYDGDAAATGKKIGADFAEGKATLPLILLLAKTPRGGRAALLQSWRAGGKAAFVAAKGQAQAAGVLEEIRQRAEARAQAAAAALRAACPPSPARQALIDLALALPRRAA